MKHFDRKSKYVKFIFVLLLLLLIYFGLNGAFYNYKVHYYVKNNAERLLKLADELYEFLDSEDCIICTDGNTDKNKLKIRIKAKNPNKDIVIAEKYEVLLSEKKDEIESIFKDGYIISFFVNGSSPCINQHRCFCMAIEGRRIFFSQDTYALYFFSPNDLKEIKNPVAHLTDESFVRYDDFEKKSIRWVFDRRFDVLSKWRFFYFEESMSCIYMNVWLEKTSIRIPIIAFIYM